MYLHNDDAESLQRMLGLDVLPERVLIEYHLRISMFHRAGGNGPLGHLGLVEMCRALNLLPASLEKIETKVEWGQIPVDGRARIEADLLGAWRPGVFRGIGIGGAFVVELDGDPVYREVSRARIRLVKVTDSAEIPEEKSTDDSSETPAEGNVEPVSEEESPAPEPDGTSPWDEVQAGVAVCVETPTGTLEGTYLGWAGGYVTAELPGGKTVTVPEDEVVLVE